MPENLQIRRITFGRTQRWQRVVGLLAAGILTSSVFAPATQADTCTYTTSYASAALYTYQRCQITDLDQRRMADPSNNIAGLPNNGNMYCVPTAAMDLLTCVANHGQIAIAPGPGYYGPESGWPPYPQYAKMTSAISQMGSLMGTDPYKGTGATGAENGMTAWVFSSGGGLWWFSVLVATPDAFTTPRLDDMAAAAVAGGVVAPGVGWYKGSTDTGFTRVGGHQLALATAKRSGSSAQIGLRDPALVAYADDPISQGAFTTETYNVVPVTAKFNGETTKRTQDQVLGLSTNAFIDNYLALLPPEVLTAELNYFHLIKPLWLTTEDGSSQPKVDVQFSSADSRNITDVAVDPMLTRHVYLTDGSNTVWELDSLTGRSTFLATVEGARRVVIGGKERRLYVLTPNAIVALGRDGRALNQVALKDSLGDITYDSNQDVVIGINSTGDTLQVFDAQLTPTSTFSLGQTVAEGGDISLQFDASTGSIIINSGSPRLWRVLLAPRSAPQVTSTALEGVRAPKGLTVGDNGHLLVTDSGVLVELDGQGHVITGSIFRGLPGGSRLDARRSFSNADPSRDIDPNFRNG